MKEWVPYAMRLVLRSYLLRKPSTMLCFFLCTASAMIVGIFSRNLQYRRTDGHLMK
jgi:hypothetical protein